ncbi:hypothetical protein LTR37_002788 [Vermiconidia calcicola]|uniref:Uncharacterized protein n=1 Tax=Vermiconidia calcicola TaxID=1690605 RepID=A0ACC3NRT7_9PEZI|nr:hypothetical protein LTR37_002788 [Vermiconidia calcicola]
MAIFYETIPSSLMEWIRQQKLFYVATSPLSGQGHVNLSPKGGEYFGLTDEKTFYYQDFSGSGIETISHLLEPGNGRITIMFNAFDGPPKIIRLWGCGRVLENGTTAFSDFMSEHSITTSFHTRSIIVVDIHQVGGSCGFSVPYYDFKGFRPILNDFFSKKERRYQDGKEDESMDHYWAYKNAWSMDGLPALQRGAVAAKKYSIAPIKKMIGPVAPTRYKHGFGFTAQQVLLIALLNFFIGLAVAFYAHGVAEKVVQVIKGSPLELNIDNMTHAPSLDGLTGLWSTK